MPTSLPVVNRIDVASPCPTSWDTMTGDDRVRYCGICEKSVYNFSAMSAGEIEKLILEKEGRLCGRFFRRADGTMMTADCPVSASDRVPTKRRMAVVAAAMSSLFLAGCLSDSAPGGQTGSNPPAQQSGPEGELPALLGKIAPFNQPPRELLGEICVKPAIENPPAPKAGSAK